jgi:hypothetical protein
MKVVTNPMMARAGEEVAAFFRTYSVDTRRPVAMRCWTKWMPGFIRGRSKAAYQMAASGNLAGAAPAPQQK